MRHLTDKNSYLPIISLLPLLWLPTSFMLCFVLIVLLSIYILSTKAEVKSILIFAFLIRVSVALLDHFYKLTPYVWDDFYSTALIIKRNLVMGAPAFNSVSESIHVKSYAFLSGLVYYIFGDYQILMRVVNCFLGTLAVYRIYQISKELDDDERTSKYAAIIAAVLPSFIMFHTLDMRDAAILFLTTDVVLRIIRLIKARSSLNFLLIFAELAILQLFRTQNILIVIFILIIFIIYRALKVSNLWSGVLLFSSLIVIFYFITKYLYNAEYYQSLLVYANRDMMGRIGGGSMYLTDMVYRSWFDVIRWAPFRFVHFAFGPFPWSIRNPFMLIGFLESTLLAILFVSSFSKAVKNIYHRHPDVVVFLILFAFTGLVASSIIDSNYGTAIRHKMHYIYVFFILGMKFFKDVQIRTV